MERQRKNKKSKPIYAYDAETGEEFFFSTNIEARNFLGISYCSGFYPACDGKELYKKYFKGYYWNRTPLSSEEVKQIPMLQRRARGKARICKPIATKEKPIYFYAPFSGMKVFTVCSVEDFDRYFEKNSNNIRASVRRGLIDMEKSGRQFSRSCMGLYYSTELISNPSIVKNRIAQERSYTAQQRFKGRRKKHV